jgi:hypothetical protein
MPGTRSIENPSRRARSDPYLGLMRCPGRSTPIGPNHTVPYGTGFSTRESQAFHAWLRSISPYGTKSAESLADGTHPGAVPTLLVVRALA